MPTHTETSWVDLVEWNPISRSGFTVVRAFLENGEVRFEGDAVVIENLMRGIDDVQPSNGRAFLEATTRRFRNPYLLATDIQTGLMPGDLGAVHMQFIPVAE